MSPLAYIRRLRRLPHALLAVLVLAVAQTSLVPCAMAYGAMDPASQAIDMKAHTMEKHCAYCPPDAPPVDVSVGDCLYTHAPAVDVLAHSAQYVDALLSGPLLHASTFDIAELHDSHAFVPIAYSPPAQSRPFSLTYCVQLK